MNVHSCLNMAYDCVRVHIRRGLDDQVVPIKVMKHDRWNTFHAQGIWQIEKNCTAAFIGLVFLVGMVRSLCERCW